jgi:hypothetical protein
MPDAFSPWDPHGLSGESGPDPERIVRRVRLWFILAGVLAAAMVGVGIHPYGAPARLYPPSPGMTAAMGAVLLGLLVLAWRNLRPARLVVLGKRALDAPDPRQRRPRAERAKAMGFGGLALGWAMQAIALAALPVLVGLLLRLLQGELWPLLAFSGMAAAAGFGFQRRIAQAVHQAVDDPELRNAYGD